MQILAEAEDLPKTANIKTQLISLCTAPVFGVVLLIAYCYLPAAVKVNSHQVRQGRHR
jgi:hypothetical protein